jgi:CDP-diacylglycerol--serine O-phosphatidyltransferase
MPMIRTRYAVPNFFTSLNFLMGTFAVVIAPLGTKQIPFFGSHKTALEWASWLIVYSVLLDKLDGFFAKRLKAASAFGAEFDSLADLVAFGLAPAMLLFHGLRALAPGWTDGNLPIQVAGLSFYVLCAAWRLARYNVAQSDLKGYFVGMPSTLAGGWMALVFLLACKWTDGRITDTIASALVAFQIVLAALMISGFYLSKLVSRKSRALNLFQISNIAVGYGFGLAMKWPELLMAQIGLYTVFGFIYGLIKREDIRRTLTPIEPS